MANPRRFTRSSSRQSSTSLGNEDKQLKTTKSNKKAARSKRKSDESKEKDNVLTEKIDKSPIEKPTEARKEKAARRILSKSLVPVNKKAKKSSEAPKRLPRLCKGLLDVKKDNL